MLLSHGNETIRPSMRDIIRERVHNRNSRAQRELPSRITGHGIQKNGRGLATVVAFPRPPESAELRICRETFYRASRQSPYPKRCPRAACTTPHPRRPVPLPLTCFVDLALRILHRPRICPRIVSRNHTPAVNSPQVVCDNHHRGLPHPKSIGLLACMGRRDGSPCGRPDRRIERAFLRRFIFSLISSFNVGFGPSISGISLFIDRKIRIKQQRTARLNPFSALVPYRANREKKIAIYAPIGVTAAGRMTNA